MINGIQILQSSSPTLASPTPFAVTITFNTNLVPTTGQIASVVAQWGTTENLGNTATGSVVGLNADGTIACTVTIQGDQSAPINFFKLLVTSTTPTTDTDGLSLFSTKDFTQSMRALWEKQFQGLTNWDAITRIMGYRFNQVHTSMMQVRYMRSLRRAVGVQLDVWGAKLNQAREGATDSDYLDVLLSRVIALNGDATAEDLINVANLLGRPTEVHFTELNRAAFALLLIGMNPVNSVDDLKASVTASKLAGVQRILLEADVPAFTYNRADTNHAGYNLGKYAAPL